MNSNFINLLNEKFIKGLFDVSSIHLSRLFEISRDYIIFMLSWARKQFFTRRVEHETAAYLARQQAHQTLSFIISSIKAILEVSEKRNDYLRCNRIRSSSGSVQACSEKKWIEEEVNVGQ